MPEKEIPKLVVASNERIMSREVGSDTDIMTERWELSSPIPGVRIVNTWQIYHLIWIALAQNEAGHYLIYRSIDLTTFTLVHEHDTEILNLFWLDDGHMLFCALDGWYVTTDTGLTWNELDLGSTIPVAKTMTAILIEEGLWFLLAYAQDRKIYRCTYPGGEWEVVYDTAAVYSGRWYPAMAGAAPGVLFGAGNKMLRSTEAGESGSWTKIHDLDGIIKRIVISNQSNIPTFIIEVEYPNEVSKLYWSYDLGDSIIADLSRINSAISVQSVVPTGQSTQQTMVAVVGKGVPDGQYTVKILSGVSA